MGVTSRDRWVRARFQAWLAQCIETHEGVSINSLSRRLAGDTLGDYRGTLRGYCRGSTTVSPDRAFDIGEAIADIAPGGPVNGLLAVAVAGYYEDLLAFLEAFYCIPSDVHSVGARLVAVNVPLFAEFENARITHNLASIGNAAQIAFGAGDRRWLSLTHRSVYAAYRFLTRANVTQLVLQRTGEDVYPLRAAWQHRWDPPDLQQGDESGSDRRTLVRLARLTASSAGDLEPDRLAAVLLDFVWQWTCLSDRPERQREYQIMELLRRLFDDMAARRYRHAHLDEYEIVRLGTSLTTLISKTNERVLALSPEERLDDLKMFADNTRAHQLEYLRTMHRLTMKEPLNAWVQARKDAYNASLKADPDAKRSQLLTLGVTDDDLPKSGP